MDMKETFVQTNLSCNPLRETLRGLHYQRPRHAAVKLVSCTYGTLVVDLRPDSPSFRQWAAAVLSANYGRGPYLPEDCAHGFQALVDNTDAFYLVSACYASNAIGGLCRDDRHVDIDWPILPSSLISAKDSSLPTFKERAP